MFGRTAYFIFHDIGRVLPEHRREDFLKRLKAIGVKIENKPTKDTEHAFDFNKRYELVRNNLKIIDSQEVAVSGILNEEYDDWYDDSSEEFYYKDDDGISDMLAEACDLVHICMDLKRYKEGFEIGDQLFAMEILCIDGYGDEEFSLEDMVDHELLHCDLMQVFLDTAYCAYHAVTLEKRPEALYGLIKEKHVDHPPHGRLAIDQPQILCSLVLMLDQGAQALPQPVSHEFKQKGTPRSTAI